jgi:hypothetical protein
MSQELYYTPPTDKIFNEIKREATKIWKTYGNEHGYVDGKLKRIDIGNIEDNAMYMIAMFDHQNKGKLFKALSEEAKAFVFIRLHPLDNDWAQ